MVDQSGFENREGWRIDELNYILILTKCPEHWSPMWLWPAFEYILRAASHYGRPSREAVGLSGQTL
jgi:hypothetical protein